MSFYLRKSLTSPWLFVMVDHWLTSGMERSLARWEESQGMRAELDETQSTNNSGATLLILMNEPLFCVHDIIDITLTEIYTP